MKTCTNLTCKMVNPQSLDNFGKNKNHKDKLQYHCKNCQNKASQNWRKNNNEKSREMSKSWYKENLNKTILYKKDNKNLIKGYSYKKFWPNLSPIEATNKYLELLKEQNNCCSICKRNENQFKYALAVDHNHLTGKVRGLLCGPCNQALGLLKEDISSINNLLNYLEK